MTNDIADEINALFEYRDGDLWWKERPSYSHVDMTKPAGYIHPTGYRRIRISGKQYLAHRLIYKLHNPDWDITDTSQDNSLDHINGDGLDNRIENLRSATQSQNKVNAGKNKNNTSGYKGVTWHKPAGTWMVQVMLNGKSHYGGLFDNLKDAAVRAAQMREQMHGEFVNHG